MAWLLRTVKVRCDNDPGKDDISVHPGLCYAISSLIGARGVRFPASAVTILSKAFDPRQAKTKRFDSRAPSTHFAYSVVVDDRAVRDVGGKPSVSKGRTQRCAPPAAVVWIP